MKGKEKAPPHPRETRGEHGADERGAGGKGVPGLGTRGDGSERRGETGPGRWRRVFDRGWRCASADGR